MARLVATALLKYLADGDVAKAAVCAKSLAARLARISPDVPAIVKAPGIGTRTRKHFNGRN